jgi:hypothetical protein
MYTMSKLILFFTVMLRSTVKICPKGAKFFIMLLIFYSFTIFSEIVSLQDLEKPNSVTLDKNQIYIADWEHILIYSLKDFQLKKKFGKRGEGPGEFLLNDIDNYGLRIIVEPNDILVNSITKISYFTKEGVLLKEKKHKSLQQFFKPFGKKLIGYSRLWDQHLFENDINYITINTYDPDSLEIEKEIYRKELHVQKNSIQILELTSRLKNDIKRGIIYYPYGDKLIIEGENNNIYILDSEGKKLAAVNAHDYEKIKITEEFKKETFKYLEKRLPTAFKGVKAKGVFPEYYPYRFFTVSDNNIYVLTFNNKDGKSEFYIFNLQGKLLKRTMVPFVDNEFLRVFPYTITNGKIYQLVDNEDTEEWELHIHDIR